MAGATIFASGSSATCGGWPFTISTSTTSVTGSANAIWVFWNNGCTFTGTSISATNVTTNQVVWSNWQAIATRHEMTKKERREYEAKQKAWQAQAEKQRAEFERTEKLRMENERAARARARRLLLQCLSKTQKETMEKDKFFDVEVENRLYRIYQGTYGNIKLMDGNKAKISYCIQPPGVPIEDAMLAQKLLLESDEREFLRIANATQLHN